MPANEIPPPPPSLDDLTCIPSEPPDVRRVRGLVAVFTPLIAFGVELAWMALVSFFFWHGRVSMEVWIGAGAAPVLGPMVAKMRGKPAMATSLALVGVLGKSGAAFAAGEVAKRTLLSIVLATGLGACATWWQDAKPVVRTVNDIARELCEATMGSEAERQRVTVRDLCLLPYVFEPFLEAPHLASANAVLGRELGNAEVFAVSVASTIADVARSSARVVTRTAQSAAGAKGRGLLLEPRKLGVDLPWFADEQGMRTDFGKALAAPQLAEGYVTLEPYAPPVNNQGAWSKCVGEMAYGLISIVESVYGLPFDPISEDAAYLQSVMTHTPKGQRPKDDGTYIRACLSEIRRKGCALRVEWRPADVLKAVPSPLRAHGYNRRGLRYELILPRSSADEHDLCDAAIRQKQPIGFGWSVTERYALYSGSAPFDARIKKSDVVLGGHAQVQVSTRDHVGVVRLRNSWGKRWGDGTGHINVRAETMTRRDLVIVSGWERLVQHGRS